MLCDVLERKKVFLENISILYKEERSLRHVAMGAKFLDDNKPNWIRTVSNFIDLIQLHLICQMLKKFFGLDPKRRYLIYWSFSLGWKYHKILFKDVWHRKQLFLD